MRLHRQYPNKDLVKPCLPKPNQPSKINVPVANHLINADRFLRIKLHRRVKVIPEAGILCHKAKPERHVVLRGDRQVHAMHKL